MLLRWSLESLVSGSYLSCCHASTCTKMVRSIKSVKKIKRKSKGSDKGDGSLSSSSSIPSMPAKVWQPGVDKLEEGEELQCDPSTYNSLHAFHIGWPCLSFDIVCDTLGLVRREFPQIMYFFEGTLVRQRKLLGTLLIKKRKLLRTLLEYLKYPTSQGKDMS